MAFDFASLATAGLSSVLGGMFGSISAGQNYKYNKKLMAQQQEYNERNMNLQHGYQEDLMNDQNTLNQQNMANSGFYKNLENRQQGLSTARGDGGSVNPIAVSTPSAPSGGSPSGGNVGVDLAASMGAIASMFQSSAMADVVKALAPYQKENLVSDSNLKNSQSKKTDSDIEVNKANIAYIQENTDYVKQQMAWYDDLSNATINKMISEAHANEANSEKASAEAKQILDLLPYNQKCLMARAYADNQAGKLSGSQVKLAEEEAKNQVEYRKVLREQAAELRSKVRLNDKEFDKMAIEFENACAQGNLLDLQQQVEEMEVKIENAKPTIWKVARSCLGDVTGTIGKLLGGSAALIKAVK